MSNYGGLVDKRDSSEITVEVGVEANEGYFGFGPAAIRVSPGTTVVWNWSGQGGSHNVVDASGTFESELTNEANYTFSRVFDQPGVHLYFCVPHQTIGMKGAVVVGDVNVQEALPSSARSDGKAGEAGLEAERSTGGFFNLAKLPIQDAIMMTLFGMSGLAIGLALLPDVGLFASTASQPVSRTGYVVHRLNRFRDSWVFSVIVGWVSFLAVLVAIGALFVVLWHLGRGSGGFLIGLAVVAIVVAWYIIRSSR